MTVEQIKRKLDRIEGIASGQIGQVSGEKVKPEERCAYAHEAEDELYLATLRVIAAGAPDAAELAGKALEAVMIDFGRCYLTCHGEGSRCPAI